jgi:hypothetical protein
MPSILWYQPPPYGRFAVKSRYNGISATTKSQFGSVQSKVTRAFQAYLQTAHGVGRPELGDASVPLTYAEMIHHEPITPDDLPDPGLSSLILSTTPLEEFMTTGTRGTPRSIYWPANTMADVRSLLYKADTSGRTTATYSSAVVDTDIFLKTHLEGLRHALPKLAVRSFATSVDVSEILRDSAVVVLTDYPSALARFIRLTAAAIDAGQMSAADVRGTELIARLTGEPMTAVDLSTWYGSATKIGYSLAIELRYGCTEFLGVGKSDFDPEAAAIEYRLTNQDCFAEVLDRDSLRPIYEGQGILCATSYRTSGTILYRYLLGDNVEIFERNGDRYVKNIRRRDALIVTGNTVSLSDLVAGSRAATGLEVCIEVRKTIDRFTGVQYVNVTTHVPSMQEADVEAARNDTYNRLLDELKIRPAVAAGFVVLTVCARTMGSAVERRRKAWRLSDESDAV